VSVGAEHRVEPHHSGSFETVKRHWAFKGLRILALILPGIIASIGSYASLKDDAEGLEDRAVVVEAQADRAEVESAAGYKVTKAWVAELERRVAQLDAEIITLKRAARLSLKRSSVKVVVVNQAAPNPPPPLPANLDKAVEQVQRPPAPVPVEAPPP
jgi:hypothetical protein